MKRYVITVYWSPVLVSQYEKYTLEGALTVVQLALESEHHKITMKRKAA